MIHIKPVTKDAFNSAKPIILAVTSVIFNAIAIGSTVKATVESTRIIDEKKKKEELNTKEIIKDVAPKYILPAVAFTLGQVTTVGSALLSRDQTIALSAATAAANYRFRKYREAVVEEFGPDADEKVVSRFKNVPKAKFVNFSYNVSPYGGPGEVVLANMPDGKNIFFDINRVGEKRKDGTIDDGYFEITKSQFLQARTLFYETYLVDGFAELNTFYKLLGIDETYGGDVLTYDMSDGPERLSIGVKPKDYDEYGNILSYSIEYYWAMSEWPHIDLDDDDPPWHW